MIKLTPFLALLALFGCTSLPPPATPAQIATTQDEQCRSYGAVPGTDAYVNCRGMLAQQAGQAEMQKRAAIAQMLANRPAPYQLPPPVHREIPQPRNCTSNVIGQQIYTNCY